MNREEAKLLLAACHPESLDTEDGRLAEALALLEQDPELQAWFHREQASDRALAAKLKAAPLPEDLEARVLSGVRARLAAGRSWGWHMWPLAACLALLGVLAAVWFDGEPTPTPGSFAACRRDMVGFLREFPALDLTTDRIEAVRSWLASRHPLTQARVPSALERFPSIGCRTVDWNGRQIALVCFMAEGEVVHLFVIPRGEFPDAVVGMEPAFARVGSRTTAAWGGADTLYLVISRARESQLRRWLRGQV